MFSFARFVAFSGTALFVVGEQVPRAFGSWRSSVGVKSKSRESVRVKSEARMSVGGVKTLRVAN